MEEKEFEKELKEMNFQDGLIIPICWALDGKEVVLDIESMDEEFEMKMRELSDILN